MISVEFYYKDIKQKESEDMRQAIFDACIGTNILPGLVKLPDNLLFEDKLIEKAIKGKNITKLPTCIINKDGVEFKRYVETAKWENIREDINYLNDEDPNRQTNKIFIKVYSFLYDYNIRQKVGNIIAYKYKLNNIIIEHKQYIEFNNDKFKIIVCDPWMEYGIITNPNFIEEELLFMINKVPKLLKDVVNNKAQVL